jgi:hypothetical protein
MITAKTTALIMALTVVGAATPAAFASTTTVPGIGVVTITGQSATNSDDDHNNQANIFAPEVKSEQESKQNSGTQGSAFVLNLGTGANTATQTSAQTVTGSQSNTVNDDDEQENNQCATGPSVVDLLSCLNADVDLEALTDGVEAP